jgi:signal transduction histidine kinase
VTPEEARQTARVLVVDDEEVIRQLFETLLEPHEFQTATYPSAEAALAAYTVGTFDVAILDKNLEGMNGIELMRELKRQDPHLEVIIVTGHASLATAIEALQLGAYDYIEKPFLDVGLIVEKTRKAWERRALALTNQRLLAHLHVANRELTERNVQLLEIQEQLVAQLRMASVGQLAAMVGMEINDPLSAIKSNIYVLDEQIGPCLGLLSRLAEETVADPALRRLRVLFEESARSGGPRNIGLYSEDARQAFGEIKEEIERLVGMVRGMQHFSFAGRTEVRQVDLPTCVQRAVELVEREQRRRGIELRFDLADDLPPLRGTPDLVTQVLLNLLQNALEAIASEGLVEIRARAGGDSVRIVVSDTGCGIPREDLPKVTKAFFTTKESGRHPGLGLTLAQELVRRQGGTLRIESDPGVGTRVIVTLPVAKP